MSYTSPSGKVYKLVPAAVGRNDICGGCAFEPADSDCLASGDCTGPSVADRDSMSVYVEDRDEATDAALSRETKDNEDWLAGSKACDLSGEGPCEGCQ